MAHSLGGLIARYAIGRLYEPITTMESSVGTEDHEDRGTGIKGRIAGLEPMNFITFASPHLGSRGHRQVKVFSFCQLMTYQLYCVFPIYV